MSERIICEKCGTEMISINPDIPVGMTCPNCGWGWATTYLDPIMDDTKDYTIIILDGNKLSKEILKTIAKITNTNIVKAKSILETAPARILTDKAVCVRDAIKALEAQSIVYKVEPEFPYSLNKNQDHTY